MAKLVLIIEDDPESLMLMRDLLRRDGYKTIEATDGKQGVTLAKEKSPDLILLDIHMPVMDGYTALNTIKTDKATSNIPVVMVTATDYRLNEELARKMGAVGYITKPIDIHQFLKKVAEYLSANHPNK